MFLPFHRLVYSPSVREQKKIEYDGNECPGFLIGLTVRTKMFALQRNVLLALLAGMLSPLSVSAQEPAGGVVLRTAQASSGYTLIAPFGGQKTYLIDMDGKPVHSWSTERLPSQAAYLLEDGCLLRTAKVANEAFDVVGGPAGGIQKFDWDGNLIWDYVVSDSKRLSHHDIEPMPNGNVLVVAWELKTREEAIAAGRDPQKLEGDFLWPEVVLEIQPDGKTGGEIVWEWHLWDHLVQSVDSAKPNYGQAADHPERIDLNYIERPIADWIHMNSIDYSPQLDQIMLCGRTFDEIWVIDHSTTRQQAAGTTGGRRGKGGDLLYRWGNPFTYFAGSPLDQVLFGQHDPHWIPDGLPGAGNILIFNNGSERDGRPYSTVDELTPPLNSDGTYRRSPGEPFGPNKLEWTYQNQATLFSPRVSGAQRLPNGNTLICSGETGHVFEVDPAGKTVWDFRNYLGSPGEDPSRRSATGGGVPSSLGGVAMFRANRYSPDYSGLKRLMLDRK